MTKALSTGTTTAPQRVAARTAGYALLFMAITAVLAYFIAIESLVVAGNGPETAANIRASEGLFRAGVAGFVVIAILDVVVACAFFILLEPVNRLVSFMAAAFRLVYAAILGAAAARLRDALTLLEGRPISEEAGAILGDQVLRAIEGFNGTWELGLAVFGVHLVLLGTLFHRSGYVPRLVSFLVAIAGVGYLVDSFGAVLLSGYALSIASVAFIGEILLMLWLLFGFRDVKAPKPDQPAPDRELEVAG